MYLSTQSPWLIANTSNYNIIPKNLLPKSANQTENEEWLRDTYQYYSCFDKTVKSKAYKDDEDLQKWRNCAVRLIEDLKAIGYAEAKNEIVRIANDRFELKTIDNKPIRKWTDVVTLFTDSAWFFSNVQKHRFILYYFQYGIFRNAYNNWLLEAGFDWMRKYEVMYNENNHDKKQSAKTKKGFVQELLHGKASNSIQDRFLRITRRHLGQYILCRKRGQTDEEHRVLRVEEMTFMNYNAYVMIDKEHPLSIDGNDFDPMTRIGNCINYALNRGTSKSDIMKFIESRLWTNGEKVHYLYVEKYFSIIQKLTCF